MNTKDGKKIELLEDVPHMTGRLLNEYSSEYTYQGNGPSYMVEYQAKATIDGQPGYVYWHFEIAREGKEVEGAYPDDMLEEDYDWDNIYKAEVQDF